jgi:hypothetical protein
MLLRRLLSLTTACVCLICLSHFFNFSPITLAQQEPSLYCGVGGSPVRECSYIVWDSNGSRGFVVAPGTQMPIGNAYLGFRYCMHAAPPKAPTPNWPACFLGNNRTYWSSTDTYGVLKSGRNGG